MKKLFTLLFSITATTAAFAQAPSIQWQKALGGTGEERARSIQQTADGGYIIAGYAESNDGDVIGNPAGFVYWLVKLDGTGALQWKKALGGIDYDYAYSVQQTADGGYVIAGGSMSNDGDVTGNHGGYDYWIVKLNDTGAIQWQKSLGGNSDEYAYSIQQTADGGYISAGYSFSNNGNVTGNHGDADYWVVKMDDTGAIEWQKSLGGTGNDRATSVQQAADGGYIVAGYSKSTNGNVTGNHGDYDYWVVRISAAGILEWQKSLGGSSEDEANAIRQTTDGGYVVTGYTYSNNGDVSGNHDAGNDYWVVKLDNTGSMQWQKCLGGTGNDKATSIQQTTDSGYIVAGLSESLDGDITGQHGRGDYWVVKLDATAAIQWQKTLGGSAFDYAYSAVQTTDGGYIIAGLSESTDGDVTGNHGGGVGSGQFDYWVVKLGSGPAGVTTPIAGGYFTLHPNPATTEIFLQGSEPIRSVLLTDISGKEVHKTAVAGTSVAVPTAALPNGLYLVHITTETGVFTQKVVVQH